MIRDWGDLPMELLSSVLGRLESLSDYFEFSLVCTSWYSVAKENRSQRTKMVSTRYRPSVLLFSDGKKDTWNVYNVMVDKVLDPFLRVKGKNEEENSIIRLPPLNGIPEKIHEIKRQFVERAAIFGDPLMNADDCIVMVYYGRRYKLAYMVLGQDTTWTYITDIVCFQGNCYAVDHSNCLYLLDKFKRSLKKMWLPHSRYPLDLGGPNKLGYPTRSYLVDSNGEELLMIVRCIRDIGNTLEGFSVWKMDFNKFGWRKKETLGEAAVFVGDCHNSSVLVMGSNSSGVPGYQSNCIYFTYLTDRERNIFGVGRHAAFGVYNLQTKSFSQPHTDLAKLLMKITSPIPTVMWAVPPFH